MLTFSARMRRLSRESLCARRPSGQQLPSSRGGDHHGPLRARHEPRMDRDPSV